MGIPKLKVLPPELAFVVREVLEYDVPGLEFDEPPTVLDLGANIGAFAVWAQERWPGAAVTCFEPHPSNLAVLRQNVDCHVDDRAVLGGQTVGAWSRLNPGNNLACGSCVTRDEAAVQRQGVEGPIVPVLNASLLGSCDILKIDVEGAELDILRDYKHLAQCKAVLLEWHRVEDVEEIANILRDAGMMLHSLAPSGVQRWLREDVAAKLKPAAETLPAPSDRPHLFLAVLGWRPSAFHVDSRCRLIEECGRVGLDLTIYKEMGAGIDRGRNISVEKFRKTDCSHFMFIDGDIAFEPADIFAMIKSGLDVVGGAYPKKGIDWKAVELAVKSGRTAEELPEYACQFVANAPPGPYAGQFDKATGARFMEVDEIGTGFLLIRREVIERYIAHWREEIAYVTDYETRGEVHHMGFQCEPDPGCELEESKRAVLSACVAYWSACGGDEGAPMPGEIQGLLAAARRYVDARGKTSALGRYLTEDYSFCRRWRMMGGKVHLFLDAKLAHHGQMLFEGHLGHYIGPAKQEAAQ